MSDNKPEKAEIKDLKQISTIWVVPIIALVIGIWMLVQYVGSRGPEVTLILNTAEGIEVGKTEIKSLNVKVGVITHVTLSDDYSYIIAKADMNKDAKRMLKQDTRFWVVKPRIGKEGISGLDTLLSGSYIEMQPGSELQEQLNFTVLETPPVTTSDASGLRLVLTHGEAGKLGVGDPVLYEGFTVGRVEKVSFDTKTKKANYQLFVFQPYDSLIREQSRFWLSSGVDLQMSAEGFNLQIGSIESLLTGGVSFGVPDGGEEGPLVTTQMSTFRLYNNLKQVGERTFNQYFEYVMLFDESIRGLSAGAPVEYRGIRIGTVAKVPLSMPIKNEGLYSKLIPVLVRIEPGRVHDDFGSETLEERKQELTDGFGQGLRATLKIGNLLTGALYIDSQFYPESKMADTAAYGRYDIFPTRAGGFAEIQKKVSDLLNKFNNLPVEDTLAELTETLKSSQKTMVAVEKIANDLDKLLGQKDTQAIPGEIRKSLQQIQATLSGFGPDAVPYRNFEAAVSRFEQVMGELQPVLRQLNDKPNSLIFSGERAQDPIPAGGHKE
jgi:paraquat-inducible protein B